MVDAIGEDNSKKLSDVKNEFSKHEIMDQVKFEYKCYQVENLPNGFYELSADKGGNVNRNSRPHIGEKPAVFLILTSHNLKSAIIVELMSTGGRYILALHQKLIYHCLMFTKFRFIWCYFSEKRIILFLL